MPTETNAPTPSHRRATSRRRRFAGLAAVLAVAATALAASPASGAAGFGDVPDDRFFTAAVQWMVDNDITTGTSLNCFSPDDPVTRGQAAAFMWRMEGEPAAAPHSFTDVDAAWQQGPVSWMVAEGITTGTSPSTFSPSAVLTRGQMAALLWRLAGGIELPAASPHPFSDVLVGWQNEPVSWLAESGITTGTSPTTFSPDATVTRGQLAAFFYRYKGSPPVVVDPATPPCPAPPAVEIALADLDPTRGSWDRRSVGTLEIDGTSYVDSLTEADCFGGSSFYWEYDVPEGMNTFTSLLGMTDETASGWRTAIEIRLDSVRQSLVEVRVGQPSSVVVPLDGATRLGIYFHTMNGGTCGLGTPGPALGSPSFTSAALPARNVDAEDVVSRYVDSMSNVGDGWSRDGYGPLPIDGSVYPRSVSQPNCNGNDGPYEHEIDLGRDWDTFETLVGITDVSDGSLRGEVRFSVDGEVAAEVDVSVGSPAEVSIPVTGALRLQIVMYIRDGAACNFFSPEGLALGTPRVLRSR